jgi:predicted ArsR family transcriptional regulator
MPGPPRGLPGAGRSAVLVALRDADRPLQVTEIVAAVGLGGGTVRFHLDRLLAEGLIRVEPVRSTSRPGRPALSYRAQPPTATGAADAYRLLAGVLADQVATGGTAACLQAGARWGAAALAGLPRRPGRSPHSWGGAVTSLLAVLRDGGFGPEVRGEHEVRLHTCPFGDLARARADVICTVHFGAIRTVLRHGGEPFPGLKLVPAPDGSQPCRLLLAAPGSRREPVPFQDRHQLGTGRHGAESDAALTTDTGGAEQVGDRGRREPHQQ